MACTLPRIVAAFGLSQADDRKFGFLLIPLGKRMPQVLPFVLLEQHATNSVSAAAL